MSRLAMTAGMAALLLAGAIPQVFSVSPAEAAACAWKAGTQDLEEGSTFAATVCADTKAHPSLMLTCISGPFLTYDLGDTAAELDPGTEATFTIAAGGKSAKLDFQLQAMDNTFIGEVKKDSPVLTLLRSKGDVVISAPKFGSNSFTLRGSGAAIAKVMAHCGDAPAAPNDDGGD